MIVPQRRGELERFQPEIHDVESNPEISAGYKHWQESRIQFLTTKDRPGSGAANQSWQRHYFQGTAPNGSVAPEHQFKLNLQDFREQH